MKQAMRALSVLRLQKTQVRISARPEARWTRLSSIVKSSGYNLQITEGGVSPENLKRVKIKNYSYSWKRKKEWSDLEREDGADPGKGGGLERKYDKNLIFGSR